MTARAFPLALRGPWAATLAATAASAYLLDAVATTAGLALTASGLLDGVGHWTALTLLAASYVAWGAGLRVNLAANADLLARTGASSNVLSKAAHDLARRRGAGERTRRRAAAAGYVATELAKEAPYYAGATGAVLVSDALSAQHALVFLSGANLGAAAYEWALAHGTRHFLRRRDSRTASFETDWEPRAYLTDYYTTVEPDERQTIAYFVARLREAERGTPILIYGVGPTLHHVFLAAPVASELHLTDYLEANLEEIRRWLARDPRAHDWRQFVAYTLRCEGIREPTTAQITARESLTRQKITRLVRADAADPDPVGAYATVISAYCADSATGDREVWREYLLHIAAAVRPGGLFVTSALRRCRGYLVGGARFPCADVDEEDVRALLATAFAPGRGSVETHALPEQLAHGYDGILLATARAPG